MTDNHKGQRGYGSRVISVRPDQKTLQLFVWQGTIRSVSRYLGTLLSLLDSEYLWAVLVPPEVRMAQEQINEDQR